MIGIMHLNSKLAFGGNGRFSTREYSVLQLVKINFLKNILFDKKRSYRYSMTQMTASDQAHKIRESNIIPSTKGGHMLYLGEKSIYIQQQMI